MGAFLSRFLPWTRSGYIRDTDNITSSSDVDTLSIDSADSLITFSQNPPSVSRIFKDSKEILIDKLPVGLLLRYII